MASAVPVMETTAPARSRTVAADVGAAFLIGLGLFALLSVTPSIPGGYDAYRHVRVARLLTENPAAVFRDPWHLAYMWPKPVDAWFGYHLLLAPLTRIFDLITAAKLLASCIFGATAFILLRLLVYFAVPYRSFWTIVAIAGSSITLNRAGTSRPFLLSICLVLLVALLTLKNRPIAVALASAVHALSYSMFFLVAMAPGIWLLLRRDRQSVRTAAACALGITAGLLLNPYFPENVKFDVAVTSVVSVANRAHIEIGHELDAIQAGWWFVASLPVALFWLTAITVRIRHWRESNVAADLLLIASIAALIGSFHVGRTYDFFVPFATLFAAVTISPWFVRHRKDVRYLIALPLFICAIYVFLTYRAALGAVQIEPYRNVSAYLRTHARGELVTNAEWGEYHYLFFWNPESRYFIGMEPTLTYLMDSRKYWLWRHMSDDEPSTCDVAICTAAARRDIASAIRDELQSKFIVTNHQWNRRLETILKARQGVTEVFRDSTASVFEINF
jgi:hypothetical protein